jgi:hypothetical protein
MWSSLFRNSALVLAALAIGCEQSPVEWDATATPPDSTMLTARAVDVPAPNCAGLTRFVRSDTTLDVVWWSPRADSSARLEFARSVDGGKHWVTRSTVDSTDRSVTGCRRAPPAIAADTLTGYVHVTYGLVGAEGPGLFFSHSMDNGKLFHSPVAIMYGEHLGNTAVAASGDRVAVAFEDPNSAIPRIGLALSATMGHIFERRLLPVSDDNGAAMQPFVSLHASRIEIGWREQLSSATGSVLRVRTGTLR